MLLSLVYEEKKEEVIDKLIDFIYQLSTKDIEIAVGTLNEPICFVKEDREKQLTLPVTIIRLDNNSQMDIWALVDRGCTRSCINQQFVINYKISTKWIPLAIPVYNTDSTLNKDRSIKEFAMLQLAINNYYKHIDFAVIELEDTDLFLGYNWLKIHNSSID